MTQFCRAVDCSLTNCARDTAKLITLYNMCTRRERLTVRPHSVWFAKKVCYANHLLLEYVANCSLIGLFGILKKLFGLRGFLNVTVWFPWLGNTFALLLSVSKIGQSHVESWPNEETTLEEEEKPALVVIYSLSMLQTTAAAEVEPAKATENEVSITTN